MPNPYEATKRRTGSERESDLARVTRRLRSVGATDDELALLADQWDRLDDEWTAERRRAFATASATELAAELLASRAPLPGDPQAALEAGSVIGEPVRTILAWVGDDPGRAAAVADLERAGASRVSLLRALDRVLA